MSGLLSRHAAYHPGMNGPNGAPVGMASVALVLGALALVALPLSYLWLLSPNSNPSWFGVVIPIAEIGGLVAAVAAILLGRRARSAGNRSRAAIWGPRLAASGLGLYLLLLLVAFTRYG